MKKIFAVIIMFIILLGCVSVKKDFTLLDYFSGDYTVYTSNSSGANESVDLGFCYMNSQKVDDCVVGESMIIKNFEVANALSVLNAKVIKTECLEDGTNVVYAYTNLINEKVDVGGKRVNLQIASKDDYCVIGWPLILGSF